MFEPVVKSTGKSTQAPIREEMKTLKEHLADTTEKMKDAITAKQQQQSISKPVDESNVLEQYLLKYGGSRVLDKYFVIQHVGDNKDEMGTKAVGIDENSDIIVDGVKYDGTTRLWAHVMMNDPPESSYTQNDLHMYKDLVYRTNVMSHPHNVILGKNRYNKTKKAAYFPLLKTLPSSDEDDTASHDDDDTEDAAFEDLFQHASWLNKNNDHGDGTQFLPGGNKNEIFFRRVPSWEQVVTQNQILSILDKLLRRKRILRKEYREINTFLQ